MDTRKEKQAANFGARVMKSTRSRDVMSCGSLAWVVVVAFFLGIFVTPASIGQDAEQCLIDECPNGVCLLRPFDRGPYLQQLKSTSVIVVTQSAELTSAHIEWQLREPTGIPQSLIHDVPAHDHEFVLTGLEPRHQLFVPYHSRHRWEDKVRDVSNAPAPGWHRQSRRAW